MKRKQFTFYRSFYDSMLLLPKSLQLEFLVGMFQYALDEQYPEFRSDRVKALFLLVEPVLNTGKKRSEAGNAGVLAKREKRESPGGESVSKPGSKPASKVGSKPASKPTSEKEIEIETEIEHELDTDTGGDRCVGCDFSDFWNLYPKKIGRLQAFEEWKRMVRDPGVVMEALRAWVASDQWKIENGRYVPRADKWLREEHFLEIPKNGAPPAFTMGEAELEAIRIMMADEEGA